MSRSRALGTLNQWKEGWDKFLAKGPETLEGNDGPEEIQRKKLLAAWLAPGDDIKFEECLKYDPLPEGEHAVIRLVQLLPGKDWDPIEVTLSIANLGAEYEALSYCWGDAAMRSPITCNGCRLDVTRNLKSALRDLRRHDSPRILWIDAICINQNDIEEREQQVRIMANVFRSAVRTVVWLGETFTNNALAFKLLKRMDEVRRQMIADGTFENSKLIWRTERLVKQNAATDPTEEEVIALYALLRRPWFRRSWVIQEISLAKEVLITCGDQELNWGSFYSGVRGVGVITIHQTYGRTELYNAVYNMDDVRSHFQSEHAGHELLPLLDDFRSFLATDPRDKIFALISLSNVDPDKTNLAPDYRSSPEEIYIRLAKAVLGSHDKLAILSSAGGSCARLPKALPSWVPDWSDSSERPGSLFLREELGSSAFPNTPFNATGSSIVTAPLFGSQNNVILSGYRIDHLSTVGGILPDSSIISWDDFQAKLGRFNQNGRGLSDLYKCVYGIRACVSQQRDNFVSWDSMVLGAKEEHANTAYAATGETRELAYMRTIMVDLLTEGPEFSLDAFRKWREDRWIPELLHKAHIDKASTLRNALGFIRALLPSSDKLLPFNCMFEFAMRRRLSWTEKGYLGLVPSQARTGDEIWLLKGGRVPFVLRRVDGGENRKLVGDCYMHGIMYGEAFEEKRCEAVSIV